MRIIAIAAVLLFAAGSAMACPFNSASNGSDQTVAQSSKKLPQSSASDQQG